MLRNIRILFILLFLLVGSAIFGTTVCYRNFIENSNPQLTDFNVFAVYTNDDYTEKDYSKNPYDTGETSTNIGEIKVNLYDTVLNNPEGDEHKIFYFYADGKRVLVANNNIGCDVAGSSQDNYFTFKGYLSNDLDDVNNPKKCKVYINQLDSCP